MTCVLLVIFMVYNIVFVETYFVVVTFVGGCHLKKSIRTIYNIGREKLLV